MHFIYCKVFFYLFSRKLNVPGEGLKRSVSPHFWAEDGSDGQLWCHQMYWLASGWWWCEEFLCRCQQVTMAVHVLTRKQDHPDD